MKQLILTLSLGFAVAGVLAVPASAQGGGGSKGLRLAPAIGIHCSGVNCLVQSDSACAGQNCFLPPTGRLGNSGRRAVVVSLQLPGQALSYSARSCSGSDCVAEQPRSATFRSRAQDDMRS